MNSGSAADNEFNMDVLLPMIQSRLSNDERCCAVVNAGWVQHWVQHSRILSLVETQGDYGLFVWNGDPLDQSNGNELSIQTVFPVNDDLKLEIDYADYAKGGDVYLKISFTSSKFIFELKSGPKADVFVAELRKVLDAFARKPEPPPDFCWLAKYNLSDMSGGGGGGHTVPDNRLNLSAVDLFDPLKNNSASNEQQANDLGFEDDFNDTITLRNSGSQKKAPKDLSSPDAFNTLPRQSIAVGATHLAARESIVWLQMNSRREEYTNTTNFRVFIGTWNVNGQSPTVSLVDWLAQDKEPPDIYAVGFQELDLSKEAFLFNDTAREGEWLRAVENGLHPDGEYQRIKLVRLIGMMLIVFVRREHVANVDNVSSETVGTGIMGKLGNKGGVGVRMDFHNTSMCFVNSHLAAHPEEYERRNQDYADICSRMVFSRMTPPKTIKDHEHIYWLGDLNYRINELDSATVKSLLESKSYRMVFDHDQLVLQQRLKKAFYGFEEGAIEFQPTYKYDLGSDEWDMGRSPAWCDRILWKGLEVEQIEYRSHPTLKISDHKPVSSVFDSGVRVVDANRYRRIYEDVMKQLDKLENEFLPQVTVDNMEIKFGLVKFIEPQSSYLTIANTGQVPVKFEFIKKPNESNYCKEWLSIKPYSDFIMPGEKCDVELEVYVDKRTAFHLNRQQDKIEDILVLHLEGGKDFFITISGAYQPTCFGMSLEALVHLRQPLSELSHESLANLEANPKIFCPVGAGDTEGCESYDIPKEIFFLVEDLSKRGMNQEQLFEQPGLPAEVLRIRDCLDTSMPTIIPGSIHSVAEALLIFLEALPEPVIPYSFYQLCLEASQNFFNCQQIVQRLPRVHQNVFKYLMAFLRALLFYSDRNRLDAKTISTLFGGILLRPPPPCQQKILAGSMKKNVQAAERKMAHFVYHFVINEYA